MTGDFRMTRELLLSLCLALVATDLLAQESNPYNGTWLGTYTTRKGAQNSLVLNLSGGGGTWKNHVRIKNHPCVGQELPVTVARATTTALTIRINGSQFMPGCKDFGVKFSRTGDNAIEGRIPKMGNLTLVRQ
jgi:hypothetical protein